jgi:hypothetical protein
MCANRIDSSFNGLNYSGLKRLVRRVYLVRQDFGQDTEYLDTRDYCYFNDKGEIDFIDSFLGNTAHESKTIYKRSYNPKSIERIRYNKYNDLEGRELEIWDDRNGTYSYTRYGGYVDIIERVIAVKDTVEKTITETYYDEVGFPLYSTKITLNDFGRQVSKIELNQSDEPVFYYKTSYNELGLIDREKKYTYKDSLVAETVYNYNNRGKISKKTSYDGLRKMTALHENLYDVENRLVEERFYDINSKYGVFPVLKKIHRYDYEETSKYKRKMSKIRSKREKEYQKSRRKD